MKKAIIPLVMIVVFTGDLYAQQIAGIAIFSKIGYTSLSFSTLNKIAPPGSRFSNNFIAFGAEGYFRTNKIAVGLDANMGLQKAKSTHIKRAAVSSCVAYARLGWIIAEKKHSWIYPSIGSGIAAVDIYTYVNDETANLKNKLHYSLSFDMVFNADFIMRKIPDKEDFGTMLIGLRAGYRASIRNRAGGIITIIN